MTANQRAEVEAKFDRAHQLITELASHIKSQIGALWTTYDEVDEGNQQVVTRFRSLAPLPFAWSTIVGDVVHNARSALDLLAGKLILADGAIPSRSTQFPIGEAEGYGKRLRHDLAGRPCPLAMPSERSPLGGEVARFFSLCINSTSRTNITI
ncbi:hypothetical protein [Leifsonia sp. RAF41]|uniref:hypothetical protein n=1 Tax=Leifsonia sp. RAF41 TaxID=3233056 RepID=UPI003F9E2097